MSNSKNYIVGIQGGATFDERNNNFMFVPDVSVQDQVERFRCYGTGMQLSDGTFEFVPKKRDRKSTRLIKKLPHGSLSLGKDRKIRLILCFDLEKESALIIAAAIANEGVDASWEMNKQVGLVEK